jgi:hypothetical protein
MNYLLRPGDQARRKNPAKIVKNEAKSGANWRFSEGSRAPFLRAPSPALGVETSNHHDLAFGRAIGIEPSPERHFSNRAPFFAIGRMKSIRVRGAIREWCDPSDPGGKRWAA